MEHPCRQSSFNWMSACHHNNRSVMKRDSAYFAYLVMCSCGSFRASMRCEWVSLIVFALNFSVEISRRYEGLASPLRGVQSRRDTYVLYNIHSKLTNILSGPLLSFYLELILEKFAARRALLFEWRTFCPDVPSCSSLGMKLVCRLKSWLDEVIPSLL